MDDERYQNAKGRFYVDDHCINCSLCALIAGDIFKTNHEDGWEYVKQQPRTEKETALVFEAMALCPVSAIHDRREM